MIKSFEQFINENYNEKVVINSLCEEYGAPLFNEISESLVYEINNSINEGKLIIDANMIEEGIFDTIGKLFKRGGDKASGKIKDNNTTIDDLKSSLDSILNVPGDVGSDIITKGVELKSAEMENKVLAKIEELCKSADEICKKLSEKEENTYKTISEKMNAANTAIQDFTKSSITIINEIANSSKNKIADIITAVVTFCQRMAEYTKKALKVIGTGVVIAFALPFVLAYSLYKGALKVCEMLVEKVNGGAKILKEAFTTVKNAITNWVTDMLKQAKETLQKASNAIKDGAESAVKGIGKAFLAIVAILGQLASDVKDEISKAYNSFVSAAEGFSKEVKTYISNKWNAVSNWYKNTSTAFAGGVKNVWDKITGKVNAAVGAAVDAYNDIKGYAKDTVKDINSWKDDKQRDFYKSSMKYAVDKWGKDEVSSWIDKL